HDCIGVTVADTNEKAIKLEKVARAETLAISNAYIGRHGRLSGHVIKAASGKPTPQGAAKGGDMSATIAGDPDTSAEKVQQLADIGINHLHLRFLGEWDGETRYIAETSAELFAKEVIPRFANVNPAHAALA